MRSTIELPDELLDEARRLSGLRTKREVLQAALEEFVSRRRVDSLRARLGRGEIIIDGEALRRMRLDEPYR